MNKHKQPNIVIQDGVELFGVTVTITHGSAVVTPNDSGPVANSGGGPGEEHDETGDGPP